jgi:hypothetical protein
MQKPPALARYPAGYLPSSPVQGPPPRLEPRANWPSPFGWKLRFALATALMFSAYAAADRVLEGTGVRKSRTVDPVNPDAQLDCYAAGLSTDARAACISRRDEARDAERKARRKKEADERELRRQEDKALEDAVQRQRDKVNHEKLAAQFAQRLDAVITGGRIFPVFGQQAAYIEEIYKIYVELLLATEGHPAQALRRKIERMRGDDAISVLDMEGKNPSDAAARRRVNEACEMPSPTGWRERCATALKQDAVRVPPGIVRRHIDGVIRGVTFAGGR